MEELGALVEAARGGDRNAFGRLVGRFQDMAFAGSYARLGDVHLAQDAAQEAFVEAYLHLADLRQAAAFPGWFRRILAKQCDRQARRRQPLADAAAVDALTSDLPDPAQLYERRQGRRRLHRQIADLPPRQREAVALFYIAGHSLAEIGRYLEVPVATVKKRLFDGRQNLRQRMLEMDTQNAKAHNPSKDADFARRVAFFAALRGGDVDAVKKLVATDPDLLRLKTQWPFGAEGYFPPTGKSPIAWAAAAGDLDLVDFLLKQGVDPNEAPAGGPLTQAALLSQETVVVRLLKADARPVPGALKAAIFRNCQPIVKALLNAGADAAHVDGEGRTPADWAARLGHDEIAALLVNAGAPPPTTQQPPVAATAPPPARKTAPSKSVLGRTLGADGRPLDGSAPAATRPPPLTAVAPPSPVQKTATPPSPILETGIKIIDLLAPFKRGGQTGLFTPLSGVGKLVVLSQILHELAHRHRARIVYAAFGQAQTARELRLCWQELGLPPSIIDKQTVTVLTPADGPTADHRQAAETALGIAEDLRTDGGEVLLAVEAGIALAEGVPALLEAGTAKTPDVALSVLLFGDHSPGVEPPPHDRLDSHIAFDRDRAAQGLYPAVDPVTSRSALFDADLAATPHAAVAARVKNTLRRYADLHHQYERDGFDAFVHLADRQEAEQTTVRARRLHRFLTQFFVGLEHFTDMPGDRVALADTVEGCRAILDGEGDDLPEEAFAYVGTLADAKEKAKHL